MRNKINIANILTSMRILGAAVMLFIEPLKPLFFVVYTIAGITDALDGFVARKMKTANEFGAKLDSVADISFYAVMLIRILPILIEKLPKIIWIFVALALLLRLGAYIVAAFKYHRFASLHTWLNKITGIFLFGVPYLLPTVFAIPYCWICCIIGGLASLEELFLHIVVKKYSTRIKSVLNLL